MIPTLSTQFFEYLDHLSFDAVLPEGIGLLNPMEGNEMVRKITRQFYNLYYNDHQNRTLILGINPGRFVEVPPAFHLQIPKTTERKMRT